MSGLLGITPIDSLLGKIPAGARLAISCDPAIDGRQFLLQAARQAMKDGKQVVYVATDRSPTSIRRDLLRMGEMDLTALQFIDAYSGLMGDPLDHPLNKPLDVVALIGAVDELSEKFPKAVLCIEALSTIIGKSGEAFLLHGKLLTMAMKSYSTTLALQIKWPHLPDVSPIMDQFEGRLEMFGVEERIVRNSALRVAHLAWNKKAKATILIQVGPDGGLLATVPKIVITGAENAGKSTFVRQIGATSGTERGDTTVAIERATFTHGGASTEVFGTPGQKRFEPLIDMAMDQAAACLVLVDAANPDNFERTKELLDRVRSRGLLVHLIANKMKQPGAKSLKVLESTFKMTPIPCEATDGEAIKALMLNVITEILTGPKQ